MFENKGSGEEKEPVEQVAKNIKLSKNISSIISETGNQAGKQLSPWITKE